jgi:hypothetical protein
MLHVTFMSGENKSKHLCLYASASDQPPARKEEGGKWLLRAAKTGCPVRVVGVGLVRGRVWSGEITRSW